MGSFSEFLKTIPFVLLFGLLFIAFWALVIYGGFKLYKRWRSRRGPHRG